MLYKFLVQYVGIEGKRVDGISIRYISTRNISIENHGTEWLVLDKLNTTPQEGPEA